MHDFIPCCHPDFRKGLWLFNLFMINYLGSLISFIFNAARDFVLWDESQIYNVFLIDFDLKVSASCIYLDMRNKLRECSKDLQTCEYCVGIGGRQEAQVFSLSSDTYTCINSEVDWKRSRITYTGFSWLQRHWPCIENSDTTPLLEPDGW
jgi:hypothetical protein